MPKNRTYTVNSLTKQANNNRGDFGNYDNEFLIGKSMDGDDLIEPSKSFARPVITPQLNTNVNSWIKNNISNGSQQKKLNLKNTKHVEVCEFKKNISLEKYEFTFNANGYAYRNFLVRKNSSFKEK